MRLKRSELFKTANCAECLPKKKNILKYRGSKRDAVDNRLTPSVLAKTAREVIHTTFLCAMNVGKYLQFFLHIFKCFEVILKLLDQYEVFSIGFNIWCKHCV